MENSNSATVARLNDTLRTEGIGGDILLTLGVQNLSHSVRANVLSAIRKFSDFSEDNDPYDEHDFGRVTIDEVNFFFKVDYYDTAYKGLSPDTADPNVTRRVLTIMRADEY
ncbi:MAG: DUF3768 domain-containing protein [Robiginitomaculum sp.]|nr:DUF3768 domain-containing protein [Robiginitomaculum sp.]